MAGPPVYEPAMPAASSGLDALYNCAPPKLLPGNLHLFRRQVGLLSKAEKSSVAQQSLDRGDALPSFRHRAVPFNRLETSNWELLANLSCARRPEVIDDLRDAIRQVTGREHVFFAPSGRSAIAQILAMLPQQEVVLPAYTCAVLRPAAEFAGKRIVYVDVAKNSLNSTSAEFAKEMTPGRVLVPTHAFGIPTDIEQICEAARDRDCVTIEDVAAGFGARRNGRWLGTFGDVGVFSFERSKRLPAFRGGAIVINNERLINPAKLAAQRVASTKDAMPSRDLAFALAHNIFTHPWLYGTFILPRVLRKSAALSSQTKWDTPEVLVATPYYNRAFHSYQAGLVLQMLSRLDAIRSHIGPLVSVYRNVFRGTPIQTFLTKDTDDGGLLRFPVAFPGKERSQVLRLALQRGVYLDIDYFDRALPDPSEHGRFPNAVWAAQNVALLPLHTSLSPSDAAKLAQDVVAAERAAPFVYAQ